MSGYGEVGLIHLPNSPFVPAPRQELRNGEKVEETNIYLLGANGSASKATEEPKLALGSPAPLPSPPTPHASFKAQVTFLLLCEAFPHHTYFGVERDVVWWDRENQELSISHQGPGPASATN